MCVIKQFRGDYAFLSNMYECEITYEGLTYNNSESAFQAAKFSNEIRKEFVGIPGKSAKYKGGPRGPYKMSIEERKVWESRKLSVMEEIVRAKFTQNPELGEQLLSTGDAVLEEGNTWNDTYWGISLRTGKGSNHLGKILMKIRSELS